MVRHEAAIERLRGAMLSGPAELTPEVRRAALEGAPCDGPAGDYVEKVRRHAYRVVDADLDALRAAGWSEQAIFELTVATALGAGLHRLDAGLAAL
jgi:hypothetical protein